MKILSENGDENRSKYKYLLRKKGENGDREFFLDSGATYEFRAKGVIPGEKRERVGRGNESTGPG